MVDLTPQMAGGELNPQGQDAPNQGYISDTERMLTTLMANLPGMVYRCRNDEDWTMLFVSEGSEALTGFAPPELMSGGVATYGELIHPDDRRQVWGAIQARLAKQEAYRLTYRIFSASGSVKWVSEQGRGVFGEDGALLFLEGFVTDVSEQIWSREALRESEERFRAIAEQATETVFVSDVRGVIDYISPVAQDMFGYSRREIQGAHIAQLLAHESIEAALEGFANAVNTGGSIRSLELRMRRKDGSVFVGELTGSRYTSGSFEGVAGTIRDISERKRAEREMEVTAQAIENAGLGMLRIDRQGRLRAANGYMCKTLGYSREELLGMTVADLTVGLAQEEWPGRWRLLHGSSPLLLEREYRTKDGGMVPFEISAAIFQVDGEEYDQCFIRDISERRTAELTLRERDEQLLHAQKMESVGRLAGGVAHDYNNMLSVILGHADLALTQIEPETALYEDVEEIRKAAQRSAALTRQLLAFARRQPATPRVIDLNETVAESTHMLRRLISEDVQLVWQPGSHLWLIRIDPVQVDQVLTNLCVNARDAVSPGGIITIKTGNITVSDLDPVLRTEAPPGVNEFVHLSVADDGHGMEQDVLDHAFEPFYTTKGSGRGTGLGLATVYGIVTQNGGFVDARSELGVGSVMSAYLPRAEGAVTQESAGPSRDTLKSRGETVLLVEDEPAILTMAERALSSLGYSVLAVGDPEQAVALAAAHSESIDLLITDVIMPGMNGQILAQRVKELRPQARCLFMSGYTADVIAPEGVIPPGTQFIQKPFSVAALAAKVHEVLSLDQDSG